MSKKLFVAGLSYNISDAEFEQHFAQYGTVQSAKIITDRETGRSKGFGFIEFASDAEGAQAMEQLNNTDFNGRTIVVKEARPQNS